MDKKKRFYQRNLRICYWDNDRSLINAIKANFESQLRLLPTSCSTVKISGLTDENLNPCDLLVISAIDVPDKGLLPWIQRIEAEVRRHQCIWIPALIFHSCDFSTLLEMINFSVQSNWYFDFISPDDHSSLPIRMSNLLKINDHLYELKRYHHQVSHLEKEVSALQAKLTAHLTRAEKNQGKILE